MASAHAAGLYSRPAAPGGSEVERRINRYLKALDNREPDKLLMTVKSARVRWIDRQALPLTLSHDKVNYDKIIIIDSISFTGRTLRLAAEHVRAEWPTADIYWAVLIAFKDLADMLGSSDIPSVTSSRRPRPIGTTYFPMGLDASHFTDSTSF